MSRVPRDVSRRLEIVVMFAELAGREEYEQRVFGSVKMHRARRAAAENARYHALLPEQRRERNRRQWDAIKADPRRADERRAYNRQQMRDIRAAGASQYQRLSQEARHALNKAAYAKKVATPEQRERLRAEKREWMRAKRARMRGCAAGGGLAGRSGKHLWERCWR